MCIQVITYTANKIIFDAANKTDYLEYKNILFLSFYFKI